ncbi:MAG: hypothetical protein MZV65_31540 [Chromatiales bacterium]|nr:hypothetical protein [Chromatiales bacterium]
MAFGNGVFVAVVSDTDLDVGRVAVSADGERWEQIDLPCPIGRWNDVTRGYHVAFGGECFVYCTTRGFAHLSRDGRHWWPVETPRTHRGRLVRSLPGPSPGHIRPMVTVCSTLPGARILSSASTPCVGLAEYAEGHYMRVA